MSANIVIVGTGLAGYTTAKELRKLDPSLGLTLVTADDGNAYSKPMLSTGYRKGQSAGALIQARAGEMAETLNAEVRVDSSLQAIQPEVQRLVLSGGELAYDRLVLALGAEPVNPGLAGDGLDGVYQINDLQQYARFRQAVDAPGGDGGRRVLIIGGGLVGCEFANDLADGGFRVDMVFPEAEPLPRLLPPEAGATLRSALEDQGIGVHSRQSVVRVDGRPGDLRVELSDGSAMTADIVLSAVGLRPRTELARSAGLAVNHGIVVDRYLQTSNPGIHALGDCAEVEGHLLLYVAPLTAAARALARNLTRDPAGEERTAVIYPAMPVTVKTSCCPLVISPAPEGAAGRWHWDGEGRDLRGEYRDAGGALTGFVLMGRRIRERMALTTELPVLI